MDKEKQTKQQNTGAGSPAGQNIPADRAEEDGTEIYDTGFMKEKIKQRPVNHAKLLRRTAMTASMAVLFGLLACLTFLLLEPVISNWLNPKPQAEQVTLPEETQTEEMNPADMIADDSELAASEAPAAAATIDENELTGKVDAEVRRYLAAQKQQNSDLTVSDYSKMYDSLKELATSVSVSLVTVSGVKNGTDWFNEGYESGGNASGIIVADSGTQLLILCPLSEVRSAERISVTFSDSEEVTAQLVATDFLTSLAVISVDDSALPSSTRKNVKPCSLGSSASSDLSGSPVIAVGAPSGTTGSISYGTVTGGSAQLDIADARYKLITTDMYGSSDASGVLIDLSGKVIGIIGMQFNTGSQSNVISAVGITELRPLIEELSNGNNKAYLGVHGTDVPASVNSEQGVPYGAFVARTELDSPALEAGLQSGDVITKFGEYDISDCSDLINALFKMKPDDDVLIVLQRQGTNGYEEMTIPATLGNEPTK
ncbi:MAG: S1C family serine protease [Lachnospiraceae bacterium]|jgi:serine protease Do|nr:S1C family serine protease [Lachnospiraceae bacterium]